jgi:hypothetical protein
LSVGIDDLSGHVSIGDRLTLSGRTAAATEAGSGDFGVTGYQFDMELTQVNEMCLTPDEIAGGSG